MDKYSIMGVPLGLLMILFGFFIALLVILFFSKKQKVSHD
jgi:cbb3-type cytochrome oxidase subunit 3